MSNFPAASIDRLQMPAGSKLISSTSGHFICSTSGHFICHVCKPKAHYRDFCRTFDTHPVWNETGFFPFTHELLPGWRQNPMPSRIRSPNTPKTARGQKDSKTRRGPMLIIDGDSFAHRSYHALPKTILTSEGRPAGAILGFANRILSLYQAEQPEAVLVGWDTLDSPTYRHKSLPAYQSGRHFDKALLEQLDILPTFVAACGFANAKAPGYEADDFLAAAVAAGERRGKCLVASGDRDTFQLASDRTTILYPVRAGEMARIGPAEVFERYEVEPKQVPDFIALRGDPSDKIPGARGVGASTAASIIRRYGSLEAALAAGRFQSQREELLLYRSIATMDKKAPIPRLTKQKHTWEKAAALAEHWGLRQLARRLKDMAAS